MYLEILSDTVASYLSKSPNSSQLRDGINLTPRVYEIFHLELNDKIKLKTEVPIEFINVESVKIHGRTIKILKSDKLDPEFEFFLTNKLAELGAKTGTI